MTRKFVVNQNVTKFLPPSYKEVIEELINNGSKEDDLYAFKKQRHEITFLLVRSDSSLQTSANEEYRRNILRFLGTVYFQSTSAIAKEFIFTYWQLVPEKITHLLSEAGENKIMVV